jgi:hypothetical protein
MNTLGDDAVEGIVLGLALAGGLCLILWLIVYF